MKRRAANQKIHPNCGGVLYLAYYHEKKINKEYQTYRPTQYHFCTKCHKMTIMELVCLDA